MNSSLTSALSELAKRSEFSKSDEPPPHPSELNMVTRVRFRLAAFVPFAFIRFLMVFFIGVAATLAWESHGDAARERIASWSPHLGWLAPPAAPVSVSPDQFVTISRGLVAVRQSIDKLAADITKLQATQQGTLDKTPAPPPSPAGISSRKPVPPPRSPPVR